MAKTQTRTDLTSLKDPEDWQRHGSRALADVADVVNGRLEFDKNFKSQTVTVTFTQANVDVAVAHDLKKTGVRYLVGRKSADCGIYDGAGEDTINKIILRSSAPATVTLILY